MTVTFAVYATACGHLAAGGAVLKNRRRKPVLAVALGGQPAEHGDLRILASDVGALMIGRILSGLSAGLMTPARRRPRR